MPTELKDGTTVEDPRLDRLIEFDEESREYPILSLVRGGVALADKKPRSATWRVKVPFLIDQGSEGACVGFSIANELMARPAESRFGTTQRDADTFAVERLYHVAQHDDPWAGCYLGSQCPIAPGPKMDGTSVLSGIKAAQQLGYFKEYRWSFGITDLVLGLSSGPAVLGLWWFDTNYTPDEKGYIGPRGSRVGGHAILARGVKIVWRPGMTWETHGWAAVDMDRSYVLLRNSWGVWGWKGSGDARVTLRDMETWLNDDGEAVFTIGRRTTPRGA